MFSLVNDAFAMAPPSGAEVTTVDTIMSFAPLILLLFIFYVFIIRPQGKKQQETKSMLESLKEGDRILTSGGLIGTIVKVKDEELTVEIAKEVKVKINKNYVTSLVTKSI